MERQSEHCNRSVLLVFSVGLCLCMTFILGLASAEERRPPERQREQSPTEVKPGPYANAEISISIIPSINNTFRYDILIDGKRMMHQPHIPGLPGNEGFSTPAKARKVADMVVKKIRKNEMPPTVTIEELKKLEVLK